MSAALTSLQSYGIGFEKAGLGRLLPPEEARTMSEKSSAKPGAKAGVALVCDGLDIPLNPFVQRFIEETIAGMVRALDGVPSEPRTIELQIRRA
jgi:hypothetical protein